MQSVLLQQTSPEQKHWDPATRLVWVLLRVLEPIMSPSSIATPCRLRTLCLSWKGRCRCSVSCVLRTRRVRVPYKFGIVHVPRSLIAPTRDRLSAGHRAAFPSNNSSIETVTRH